MFFNVNKNKKNDFYIKSNNMDNSSILFYKNRRVKYIGQINEKREPNGIGIYYYKNGQLKYSGCFQNGEKDGFGTSFYINGNMIFNGYWRKDKKVDNMDYFEGKRREEITDLERNGKGDIPLKISITRLKNKFMGCIREDKWEGYGIFFWREENKKMEAFWRWDEKRRGYICLWDNYESFFNPETETIDGYTCIQYSNGDRYIGEIKKGEIHGKGTFYWKSGDKYEGGWKNNLMEGHGKYTESNGKIKVGYFHKNKYLRFGWFL